MDIYFNIDGLKITRADRTMMTADNDNLVRCYFDFSGDMWQQGDKYAVFSYNSKDYVISLRAEDNGYYCLLPGYCNAFPEFSVGIYGCYIDDAMPVHFYTNAVRIRPVQSCKPTDIQSDSPPAQFETIMEIIAEINQKVDNGSINPEMINDIMADAIAELNLPGTYAPINHDHDDRYALITHSHSGYITEHQDISGKVDKEIGKGLSSNDFTNEYKNKVDTALQSYTEQYTGTITGITMNGVSKGTSGVVDLGTVVTDPVDVSGKIDKVSSPTTGNFAALTATGGISDSGYAPSNFAPAPAQGTIYQSLTRQTNVVVAVADWISDNTFPDYPYRAAITLNGVTSSDYANVFFAAADIAANDLSPYTDTAANTVYIFANSIPSAAVTIPLVEVIRI